jgi:transposase InsO family protein
MDPRLHSYVDSRRLALCGCRDRSVLPARGRLVDECSDDSAAHYRCPGDGDPATSRSDALMHYSNRGSQYTSEQLQKLMADHGIVYSMRRSGNVWDTRASSGR